jgi:hypothetical protein
MNKNQGEVKWFALLGRGGKKIGRKVRPVGGTSDILKWYSFTQFFLQKNKSVEFYPQFHTSRSQNQIILNDPIIRYNV